MKNFILLLASILIVSCGNDNGAVTVPSPNFNSTISDNNTVAVGEAIEFTVSLNNPQSGLEYTYSVSDGGHDVSIWSNGVLLEPNKTYTYKTRVSDDKLIIRYVPKEVGEYSVRITTTYDRTESETFLFTAINIPTLTIHGMPTEPCSVGVPFTVRAEAVCDGINVFYLRTNGNFTVFPDLSKTGAEFPVDLSITPLKEGIHDLMIAISSNPDFNESETAEYSYTISSQADDNAIKINCPTQVSEYEAFTVICSFSYPLTGTVSMYAETSPISTEHYLTVLNSYSSEGVLTSDNHTFTNEYKFYAKGLGKHQFKINLTFTPTGSSSPTDIITFEKEMEIVAVKNEFSYTVEPYNTTPRIGEAFDVVVKARKENFDGFFTAKLYTSHSATISSLETNTTDTEFTLPQDKPLRVTVTPTCGGAQNLALTVTANGVTDSKIINFTVPVMITAKATPDGYATFEGEGLYNAGDRATITARPVSGYRAETCLLGSFHNNILTFTVPNNDTELSVTMRKAYYNVDIVTTEGGRVSTRSGEYEFDSELTLAAVPDEQYNFTGYYSNGILLSNDVIYTYRIPAHNSQIEAHFAPKTYATIETLMDNSESFEKSEIKPEYVTGGGVHEVGTTITLNAVNRNEEDTKGYRVEWWCNGQKISDERSPKVKVTEDATYTAKYIPNNFPISVHVQKDPFGTAIVDDGSWGTAAITKDYKWESVNTTTASYPYHSQYTVTTFLGQYKDMNGIYKNGKRIYIENEGVLRVEVENSIVCAISKILYSPILGVSNGNAVENMIWSNPIIEGYIGKYLAGAPYGETLTIDAILKPGYRFLYWIHYVDGKEHARIYEKRHTFTIDDTYVSFVNYKPEYYAIVEKITETININQTD